MTDLKDKIIIITGASSGIGAACAHGLAKIGSKLILIARRGERLAKLKEILESTYQAQVHTVVHDITDLGQVQQILPKLPLEWQGIYGLINNAGLALGSEPLAEGKVEDWNMMIDTNVKALLYMTKLVLPLMIANDAGHIVNIGSIAGHQTYPKGTVYCATKAAVNALTEGLKMDLLGSAIRVTAIDPGMVDTEFSEVRYHGDKVKAEAVYHNMTPLMANDVADAVIYALTRPKHVNVLDMILLPTDQASTYHLHRHQ